jgi:hypothetical protein
LGDFLFFWIQIQNFELDRYRTGRNRYRAGPVPPVSNRYRAGPVPPVPTVSGPVLAGSVNLLRTTPPAWFILFSTTRSTLTWQYLFFTFLPSHRVPRQPCTIFSVPRSSKRRTLRIAILYTHRSHAHHPYPSCTIFPPKKNIY